MSEILKSLIPFSGEKFVVTETSKGSGIVPGSTGFFSQIHRLDDYFQNVVQTHTILVKKGKTGKDRLMHAELHIPIFLMEGEVFPKIMPTDEKRSYTKVEIDQSFNKTYIMEADTMDFIGWASATHQRLVTMNSQAKHAMWPEETAHPLNILNRILEHFEERAEEYLEKFNNHAFRERVISELRIKDSSMAKIAHGLLVKRSQIEAHAAKFLIFTNEGQFIASDAKDKTNEFRFTENSAQLTETLNYYKSTFESLKQNNM